VIILAILFLGLFVSLVSIFLGLGGGILLVPLLPTFFSLTVKEAVATSIMTIFLVVSHNTYRFNNEKNIRWRIVWIMGPISAIAAAIAAQFTQILDSKIILKTLVVLLVLVVLRTLFSFLRLKTYVGKHDINLKEKIILFCGGILAGFTSGFAGVGSGVILNPIMILTKSVASYQLTPTANANMMFTTSAAFLSFMYSGFYVKWNQWGLIRWDIALGLFISAAFFGYFLRPQQNKLPLVFKSLLLVLLLLSLITKLIKQISI
jgi:uncharacterized protein